MKDSSVCFSWMDGFFFLCACDRESVNMKLKRRVKRKDEALKREITEARQAAAQSPPLNY